MYDQFCIKSKDNTKWQTIHDYIKYKNNKQIVLNVAARKRKKLQIYVWTFNIIKIAYHNYMRAIL